MPTIGINPFVRRQTVESEFSHFSGNWTVLLELVHENFEKATAGYRDGVLLVPVPAEGFFSAITQLKEGDALTGKFTARRPGETAYKEVLAFGEKLPAKAVDVVIYSREALNEDREGPGEFDWEVVSINARTTEGEEPLAVEALMRNFFHEAGGTNAQMSNDEFVEALRVSRDYWRDKARVASKG